ncbi:Ribosomal RNA large subunit methyltransferase E [Artemisia annua]|uniref:Ribosomal RNA large subunit methyltransferase E n=1 Tax=Artemisia annua TaxID=35608 RepID=A0A2U1PWG9_ARTAN|nr:Ribosomal RNA large subunit methyltransferase E [Artemisia annua]
MGQKAKGKHRLDKFYHLAKEHGYRSRAVWKIIQLDSKHNFLRSSHAVLDLCAAPGGWMQAAVERVPVGSLVLGVDLDPIRPIRGAIAIQEDITSNKCRASVKRIMGENGVKAFDLVLHDGSPNVGGAWAQEATSQNSLVIDSIKLASELLAPKGVFVTKVFRSRDYNAVLYCLRQLFEKVEVDKPAASRSTSAEIYIIGLKYKAPSKIDPRLFDVRHLFQGGKEPPKVIDVLRATTKQKRHRDGYDEKMEELMEEAYEQYLNKKEGTTKQRKRMKKKHAEDGELLEGNEDEDEDADAIHPDEDSDNDQREQESNPLMVSLDDYEPTAEEIAAKWFSQDVFDDDNEQENTKMDLSEDEEDDDMQVDTKPDNQIMVPRKPTSKLKQKKPQPTQSAAAAAATEDMEVVPAINTDSSDDSSSDESDYDVETKAEILACAKKMLRKKQREHMLDDAYNKYMFHDDEGLPKWFIDEEKKHMQPMKPITKEEVNAMKAQFREINARPAKKVAQAKARKKRVAMRKMEKVRKKANTIADQEDINDRSKMKMIDSLYKKAVPTRPKKELVVAKKGVQVRTGKGKVLVDRRMKKDLRKNGMKKDKENAKKKGGKGKGKGGKGSGPPKGKMGRSEAPKGRAGGRK